MFNFTFTRKTRSKPRPHPLFSALHFFTRPLYAQRKIYTARPPHPAPTLLAGRPRKRLVYDPSLRQLRTERTLRVRRPRLNRTVMLKPIKTGSATFEELSEEVNGVVKDLASCKIELSAEDKIFLQQLESLNFNHGFNKELLAARELVKRGEKDAPRLEKARQARAAMAARDHEASVAARRAEKRRFENISSHHRQSKSYQLTKSQLLYEAACQQAQHRKSEAARRHRVVDTQVKANRLQRRDLATEALLAGHAKQAAAAAREEAARKVEQTRREALRKQEEAARAKELARNDALWKEHQAVRAAEQARIDEFRRQQEALLQAELQRQEARRQHQAYLQQQEELRQQEALRQHQAYLAQEALRQQREQAAREAREQAEREQAAREKAARDEAQRQQEGQSRAAMQRREEGLRQAASGQEKLSPAAARQEQEDFEQRKVFVRQKHLAASAEATQQGVGFIPYEPEPINAFALYELKWEVLKANKAELQQLTLTQLPWPVFEQVTGPEIITYAAVHAFVFDETRPCMKNKTKRDRLRPEILRYHPDKFNNNVLPLIHPDHVELVTAAADRVAKFLNHLMELPM